MRYHLNIVIWAVFLAAANLCDCNGCLTPDSQVGECKLATECETIPFLRNGRRTRQQNEYLKKSSCGTFQGLIAEICCPLSPSIPSVSQTTFQPVPTTIVDESTTAPGWVATECLPTSLPPNSKCCGIEASAQPRIQGGSEAGINQYPWLALLEYRDIDAGFIDTKCGGSLISGRYVLTAAQCVDASRTNIPESVRLGEYDTLNNIDCVTADWDSDVKTCNTGSISITIQKIIIHELFKPGQHPKNDIALLRLTKMATFSDFIRPICLPAATATIPSNLYVAGWGTTSTGHRNSIKMHVMVPFVNMTTCNPYYHDQLHQGQICAGGEIGRDSCKGDSGGPLMYYSRRHYVVLGIVSYGSKPCGEYPGVYTNVVEYLEWIRINMLE